MPRLIRPARRAPDPAQRAPGVQRAADSGSRLARSLAGLGALVLALFASDAAAHGGDPREVVPPGTTVVAEALDGDRLDVYLLFPEGFLPAPGRRGDFDEVWLEEWQWAMLAELVRTERDREVRGILPWTVDPADPQGGWVPLPSLLPPIEPPPSRPFARPPLDPAEEPRAAPRSLVWAGSPGQVDGFLSGRVVHVSAGHGFTWTSALNRWATQRGNTNEIVEDLVSVETVNHYLIHYLENAGATVFTSRERDLNPRMVIVDAEPGGATSTQGGGRYEEHGPGWFDSTVSGFRAGLAPYHGNINPFAQGGNRVIQAVSGQPTASAQWIPNIPEDGHYRVYVSYSQHATRVRDAHYVVRHPGGDTAFRVNQELHGQTWVDLGRFWFYAGEDASRGSVILYNDSLEEPGDYVSADAVRFGGGMGDAARGTGSGVTNSPTSGRPRWEECARYHVQFSGAPPSVFASTGNDRNDDVGARSRYAAWQHEHGEDAVYVSWHTNAPNPGRGTSTFVYGPNAPDGSYNFTGVAGSDALARAIHDEIVNDVRRAFDPTWRDRGVFSAYFGEINPNHNPHMPAALVEVAFHDTLADALHLREPHFRKVAARAFYQGIVKYFAARDGVAPALLPEPPERVRVAGVDPWSARVAWAPSPVDSVGLVGDAATSYKVYRSADGRAWDNGTLVLGGATELVVTGLEPGVPAFFRVTGVNPGGESFPSPTVAVSTTCGAGPEPALLVYGFYRLDAFLLPRDNLTPWSLGQPYRLRQDEVNTFAYLVEHAMGWAAAGVPFDSAEAPAVERGDVALAGYRVIDWTLGEESTADETFNDAEQALVTAWRSLPGPRLLVASGAELFWDLDHQGSASDKAFAHATFGASYKADKANTWGVVGAGPLAGVPALTIDDGTLGVYQVFYPDVMNLLPGASEILAYDNGDGAAGVWFESGSYRAASFGVPLEAFHPTAARHALFDAIAGLGQLGRLPPGGCSDVGPGEDVTGPGEDTAGPEDTWSGAEVSPSDAAVVDATPGIAVRPPHRLVSSHESVRPGDGCAGGAPVAPPVAALLLLAWLALRRHRGGRGGATGASR